MRKAVLKGSKRGPPNQRSRPPRLGWGHQPGVDTNGTQQQNTPKAGGFDFEEGSVIENG